MGDDQPTKGQPPGGARPSPAPAPQYENNPPTSGRTRPTWAWVVLVIIMVIIGLPLLAIGAIYLYCLLNPLQLSFAKSSADPVPQAIICESHHA